MVSIKTPIVLAGIGLALVIIFMSISKFGIPTISKLGDVAGKGLGDLSSGFTDFFNSIESNQNESLAESIRKEDPNDPFFTDAGESRGSPQIIIDGIPDDSTQEEILQAVEEQTGITGADSIVPTDNGGLIITQNDKEDTPFDFFKSVTDFLNGFGKIPDANAESPPIQNVSQDRPLNLDELADKTKSSTKNNTRSNRVIQIETDTRTELDTNQEFKTFTSSSDGRAVSGVIRETKRDPRKLKTNSKGIPQETASQRANRVFLEQNEFADESRFDNITKAKSKTRGKSFGTNTGRGLRIPTRNKGGETSQTQKSNGSISRAEALRLAEERARKTFDSRGIQN